MDSRSSEVPAPAMVVAGESTESTAEASAGESSSTPPLDAQTGNAHGADWQEELYQKIKSMKEMYLSELNDLYQKIASKVQQHDSLPQRPKNEQIEKLKMFKMTLERIVLFLGLNKHDIQFTHKGKLFAVEKHISFFLRANRPLRKPTSSPLQEQLPQSSMQLQQPQSLDGQTNPLMQPVRVAAMLQNSLTTLQDNSLSGISTISNSQQHMRNIVQSGSNLDMGQSNSLNSVQQVAADSLQQNPVNSPQQVNISSLSPQSGTSQVQESLGFLQQNSNALQQSLPKQYEQQMLQNQKLTSLCNQQPFFQLQQSMQQQQAMQQKIVQSPSTPLAPSPMQGDSEKVCTGLASHTTSGNIMHQQAIVASAPQLHQALSPQNNLTNLQHSSLSGISTISNSQQNMINTVQPGSSLDLRQDNLLDSLQQVANGFLQQNPVNSPQLVNVSSLSSQSGTNPVQANLSSLQQSSSVLRQSLFKQHQQQLLSQQYHQLQMQQLLFQRQQSMQMLMQQQQAKRQQTAQLPPNQMLQLHQMSDANDIKMRQQMGISTGVSQQQQSVGQPVGSHHPQLKSGISSPQVHRALYPQNNLTNVQHSSISGISTISNSQENMINTVQPGSSLDLGQGNLLNSLQQMANGSLQQNPVNSPQLVNLSSLGSQSGTNPVQANLGSLQQSSSVVRPSLFKPYEQQLLSQLQMQQLLLQRQQLMQMLMQQQQAKRQQTVQLPTNQVSQLHQMTDTNDLKMKQQMGMTTGVLQQQSVGQPIGSNHPQLKSGISSPQLHQALLSPQWGEKGKVEGDATLTMEFEPYTSIAPTSLDSTSQTGNANGANWQEEVYQKIKFMKEMYVSELNDLYQKTASGMRQSQNTKYLHVMGSGPQDTAFELDRSDGNSDGGLGYARMALGVSVSLLLVVIGWVLLNLSA